MSRLETDVLVVGAGPGGSATAYHLARHGVDVTIVERSAFPREKVCGDGLTPRGVAALLHMGVDPSEPGFERLTRQVPALGFLRVKVAAADAWDHRAG